MIQVGIVGYGYWGPNLARNFSANAETEVRGICDGSKARRQLARTTYPGATVVETFQELVSDENIEAIVIATPVSSHFEIAHAALQAGKHVLIEKPMTSTSGQAEILIDEAAKRDRILMVDHTFVYTGAVRKIHEILTSGSFGALRYYDSTRVNLGLFRHDTNVLWDLAIHDLSILEFLTDKVPLAVSATGISHVEGEPENMAFLTAHYENDFVAHINVNWLSPVKVRQTLIGGTEKMIVYNDLEVTEKLKIYDSGITIAEDPADIRNLRIDYRIGDLWSPKIPATEALAEETTHFVDCIRNGAKPMTGGERGLSVVRILEAADQSLRSRGQPVEL